MFNIPVNFQDAKEVSLSGNGMIKKGKYTLKVIKADSRKAQQTGNQYLSLECENSEGQKVFHNITVFSQEPDQNKQAAMKNRFYTFVQTLNPNIDMKMQNNVTEQFIVNKVFNAVVDLEQYENRDGETKVKGVIRGIEPFAGASIFEVDENQPVFQAPQAQGTTFGQMNQQAWQQPQQPLIPQQPMPQAQPYQAVQQAPMSVFEQPMIPVTDDDLPF